jgi:ferredoxin
MTPDSSPRLRIDSIACDGVGICSHLAPDVITVDAWGYPILSAAPLLGRLHAQARRASAGCPRRALFIDEDNNGSR